MFDRRGILKVFLSSTYKDLKQMRGHALYRLISALEGSAMERFISNGSTPQKIALKELGSSDIAIFLVSPYYGTDIAKCEFIKTCKADCGMKTGDESISYTWCEFRVALSENMPHLVYIIDEGWDSVSRNGAPKLWKMRDEFEREYCPRIKNSDEGVKKVTNHLAENIINWYSNGRINLKKFCGRREILKELFNKMNKSVEIYGVGGIGKTTLCEVALIIHKLLGRKVIYVGLEEGYASGTGYEYASRKLLSFRFPDLTINDIIDVLMLGDRFRNADEETKINGVLNALDKEGAILFIDNFKENAILEELIRRGNGLNRGCILISSKKEQGIAFYRLRVASIEEEERSNLVKIMASRMGKVIKKEEIERIVEISEGHPMATYVLVSNIERLNREQIKGFKEELDFSRDNDVKEYMNRVIKSAISSDAYELLEDLSAIEEKIDMSSIYEAFSVIYSFSKKVFMEFLDASIMERRGNTFVWRYNQIREAFPKKTQKRHKLAVAYYQRKLEKYGDIEDEIKMLYHNVKIGNENEIFGILKRFLRLSDSMRDEDPRLLLRLGEEIKMKIDGKDRARISTRLGSIYWRISRSKDKTENCKKAIKAYEEALRVYTIEDFPEYYAATQNNLGAAYSTLAEVKDKTENCKKAIKACEEALEVYTLENFPTNYAKAHRNLGFAYSTLAEVKDKTENCRKAIKACEEALKVYTIEDFPEYYAKTHINLGAAYNRLAEVKDRIQNCRKAIKAYSEALKVDTLEDFPEYYAMTHINLGAAYSTLAEVKDKTENCKKAIKACEEALKVYTIEDFPEHFALVCTNLGDIYSKLAEVENRAENCKKAIKACEEALRVYTLEDFPTQYATVQNNIGGSYGTLAKVENRAENCKKAIKAYKEALEVFAKEGIQQMYEEAEDDLEMVLNFCGDMNSLIFL